MRLDHQYVLDLDWTGDRGTGTSGYRAYGRDHVLRAAGKPDLLGSADRPFFGDADRWNPEEMLLAALASCHLLSYLHVASEAGVVVTRYTDAPTGTMVQSADGGGRFERVVLHPVVTVADATMVDEASGLHRIASSKCFIASSVNFPVDHESETLVG